MTDISVSISDDPVSVSVSNVPGPSGASSFFQGVAAAWPPAATPTAGWIYTLPDPVPAGTPAGFLAGYGAQWDGLAWVNIGPVRGPAGPAGPQGEAGPAGSPGVAGAQGPQGDPGPAGSAGPAGAQGPQGIQGPAGSAGATGPAGVAGATGSTGATGAQGPQGPAGVAGAAGATGPAGPAGASAPSYSRRFAWSSPYSYSGRAAAGSATSASVWTIKRSQVSAAGAITATLTATSVAWDDYATASYS